MRSVPLCESWLDNVWCGLCLVCILCPPHPPHSNSTHLGTKAQLIFFTRPSWALVSYGTAVYEEECLFCVWQLNLRWCILRGPPQVTFSQLETFNSVETGLKCFENIYSYLKKKIFDLKSHLPNISKCKKKTKTSPLSWTWIQFTLIYPFSWIGLH